MQLRASIIVISSFFMPLYAMEKKLMKITSKNKLNIYTELTDIKEPWSAKYLTNESVVIAGKDGCSIVNWKTTTSQKIYDSYCRNLDVDQDKKKIVFSHDKEIMIYDGQTGKQEWSHVEDDCIKQITFKPSTTTNFSQPDFGEAIIVSLYNYHNEDSVVSTRIYSQNDMFNLPVDRSVSHFHDISFHPNQEALCIARCAGGLVLYKMHDFSQKLESETINLFQDYRFCTYSPNGSFIAFGNEGRIDMIDMDVDHNNKHSSLILSCGERARQYRKIAFSPKGSVLATLAKVMVENYYVVKYWDVTTRQCIYKMPRLQSKDAHDLAFSPDGTSLLIALENKCIIVPVPCEVMY